MTGGEQTWFFSGYDCDSLAMEPVTGFAEHTLNSFPKETYAWLELRTKSSQVRTLLARPVLENCVVAYSLSPQEIIDAYEHKTPSLMTRLSAIEKLRQCGWKIGLRFDPVIYHPDYKNIYDIMFQTVFSRINAEQIHSVSLGGFRLPETFFKNMIKLYPYEPLFAGPLDKNEQKMIAYRQDIEQEMLSFCEHRILQFTPLQHYFPCR
jgi:spore photoproduct lyase